MLVSANGQQYIRKYRQNLLSILHINLNQLRNPKTLVPCSLLEPAGCMGARATLPPPPPPPPPQQHFEKDEKCPIYSKENIVK